MSHATLSLILEYIYTGEVIVPSANLSSFIEAAKSLHIKGLENVVSALIIYLKLYFVWNSYINYIWYTYLLLFVFLLICTKYNSG